jgi:hypothetical protein
MKCANNITNKQAEFLSWLIIDYATFQKSNLISLYSRQKLDLLTFISTFRLKGNNQKKLEGVARMSSIPSVPEYFKKPEDSGMTVIAFADSNADIDSAISKDPFDNVNVDLRRKHLPLPVEHKDPSLVFNFNDPLLSRQWHLVTSFLKIIYLDIV